MKLSEALRLANKCRTGLTDLGAALGVAHCTPAELTTLIVDLESQRGTFNTARSLKTQAYLDLRESRSLANIYAAATRDYLKPKLGAEWNGLWVQVGFTGPGLDIPTRDGDRVALLTVIRGYFAAHAAEESTVFDLTQERAEELRKALSDGLQAVTNCKQDTRGKRDVRDAALEALEKKLRCLWKELESLLDPMDSRWLKFVDRIPGDPRVPERVEDVVATAEPGGIIAVDWRDTARAARYKVFKQVVGTDAELVEVATVEVSEAELELASVPSGTTVKLQIVPVNSAGPGPASEVVVLLAA